MDEVSIAVHPAVENRPHGRSKCMGEQRFCRAAALPAAVAVLGTGTGIARAQSPAPSDAPPILEEIVVTAEKRSENLQRVRSPSLLSARRISNRAPRPAWRASRKPPRMSAFNLRHPL